MSVEQVRIEREARESVAALRAATLQPGLDIYASDKFVMSRRVDKHAVLTTVAIIECETHWDACLVLLAYGKGE